MVLLSCLVLLAGCFSDVQQMEETWVLEDEKVITFSDGESADLWRTDRIGYAFYKLSDRTMLLTIQEPSGPDNVFVGGVESFADLSESVQDAVSTFYKEQGVLYDTRSQLQNAYADYLTCKENGTEFNKHYISQNIAPSASNKNIMSFLTSVILPVDGQIVRELRWGAAFNRETGEVLSNWDLFTLPEAEARQWLLDAFDVDDPIIKAEMDDALKPEYIILFPENLEVTFPQGTLPSQAYSYGFGIKYNELQDVLHPWAIPNNPG